MQKLLPAFSFGHPYVAVTQHHGYKYLGTLILQSDVVSGDKPAVMREASRLYDWLRYVIAIHAYNPTDTSEPLEYSSVLAVGWHDDYINAETPVSWLMVYDFMLSNNGELRFDWFYDPAEDPDQGYFANFVPTLLQWFQLHHKQPVTDQGYYEALSSGMEQSWFAQRVPDILAYR